MSTFKYNPAPKPGGGSTTRVVLGLQVQESAVTAKAATDAGITGPQAELCIKSLFQQILAAAANCGWSDGLYGLFRFRPTSGGSKDTPDGFANADDINADVSLSFLMSAIRDWRAGLTLQSLGGVGKVTPVIENVFNEVNGHENEYTPGGMLKLMGDNLRFDPADLNQGVFFTPASGPEVRATYYGKMGPGSLVLTVPSTLTGPQTLRIAAFINGSIRSFTFTDPITQSV